MVIAQAPGEKSRHKGTRFEADTDPLTFRRTTHSGRGGLWSPKREKALSCQSREGNFEAVRCNREESIGAVAVAAPNLFYKRMVGRSVLEMDEFAAVANHFVQTWLLAHIERRSIVTTCTV